MCDYSGKLVAWMDGELDSEEMVAVGRHCEECADCRTQLERYRQASKAFDAYCDAVTIFKTRPRRTHLVAGLSVAAAAVLALAVGWVLVRSHSERLPAAPAPQALAALSAAQLEVATAPNETVPRHHVPRARSTQEKAQSPILQRPVMASLPPEPAIQIAIPADSMFPPGAIPEGINFTADVNFAPDGSARQIRLQPRLTGFERRTIQQ
jgi:negative regulator of sigma E activity